MRTAAGPGEQNKMEFRGYWPARLANLLLNVSNVNSRCMHCRREEVEGRETEREMDS